MNRLKVNLERRTSHSYEIHIGDGILDRMALIMAKKAWGSRYVIVTDSQVDALHGQAVQEALAQCGMRLDKVVVPPGEAAKEIGTVLAVTAQLTQLGADRTTALIALGGGVVGDLTGFAASIYMRGIPVLQVPTTLLAQVDSSIGGKTGVDTAAGKNLLGTFHQPKGVFIDLAFLKTLPEDQFLSGLAEVIKYGIIETPELLGEVEEAAAAGTLRDPAFLDRVVGAACRIKKGIVEIDEQDRGVRRILNFGHTVGHAIEAASNYRYSHGEAVAMGMVAAGALAERLRYLPAEDGKRIAAVLRAAGLPYRIPRDLETDALLARMNQDKKKSRGKVPFVLLKKLGVPFVNGDIPEALVRETLEGLKS